MRREHAQHARAARKRTVANHQGACGLCPRAFPAKRRTQIGVDPEGVGPALAARVRAVVHAA